MCLPLQEKCTPLLEKLVGLIMTLMDRHNYQLATDLSEVATDLREEAATDLREEAAERGGCY